MPTRTESAARQRTSLIEFSTALRQAATWSRHVDAQDTHDWNDPAGGVCGTFVKWTPVGPPGPLDTA